jgi:inorganic triphosphatase YgiF
MPHNGNCREPRELELKLEVDPGDIERFRTHPFFRSSKPAKQLRAVYFDTGKLALRDNGISFRVRAGGGKHVQTIKAERPGSGVALDRGEWEHEIASAEPDFSRVADTPLEPFVRNGGARKIRPVFTVHTERLVGHLSAVGAEIELALDAAQIEAGGKQATFAEIELELKSGDPKRLYAAASELAEMAPARLSLRTKSARGYALLAEKPAASVKAEKIIVRAGQNAALAFQTIAHSCLRHLLENETILRSNPNGDAVHQARVAIRRLRAAISLFKDVVADDQIAGIKAGLKLMAQPLGQARDLDLFIDKVLKPARRSGHGVEAILADYRARREEAYATALAEVRSAQFGRSLLRIATWVETGPWLTEGSPAAELPGAPTELVAVRKLGRLWTRLRKRLKHIDEIDEESRHRVRIEIKKLRYAMEFFVGAFPPGRQKQMRAAQNVVEALQSTLGDLNDIAVARETAATSGSQALFAGQETQIPMLLARAKEQANEFRSLQPFWADATLP